MAGVAALMLSVNPNLTELAVRNILNSTATDMGFAGFDNTYGHGRVNAEAPVMGAYPSIAGPGVCSPQTFSVFGLPPGGTVSWSSDNTSALTINSAGLATRVGSYNGYATLRATISGGCVAYSQITKSLKVGSPDIIKKINGNIAGTTPVNAGNLYSLSASSSMAPVNFNYNNYTGSGNMSINLYTPNSYETQMYVSSSSTSGSRHVRVTATNECGSYYEDFVFYLIGGGLRIAYPNPAQEVLTVEINSTINSESFPENIKLVNEKSGLSVKTISPQELYSKMLSGYGNKIEIDVKDLPRGTYYLHTLPAKNSNQKLDKIRIVLD